MAYDADENVTHKALTQRCAACYSSKSFRYEFERYQPSCDQLKQLGRSPVVQHGNDMLFVYTTEVYFYMVGVNLSTKHVPFTHWWGGDRGTALSQCVDRQ